MVTVTFDGVEYTKAAQVAKQFGYTSDYIGQLCRAKKVNARLVGRSWFVNIPSLEAHRENKHQNLKRPKLAVTESDGADSEAVQIHKKKTDTPSKKYLRRVPSPEARVHKIVTTGDKGRHHVAVQYEADDHSLLPRVSEQPTIKTLRVGIAGAESVPVDSDTAKAISFTPEQLPDVALSGDLSISEISDDEYVNTEVDERPSEGDQIEEENKSSKRDNKQNKLKIKSVTDDAGSEEETEKANSSESDSAVKPPEVQQKPKKTLINTKKPTMQGISKPHQEIRVANLNKPTPQPVAIDVRVVAASVLSAVAIGALFLSFAQVGNVTPQFADFDLEITLENITNMALVLFTG